MSDVGDAGSRDHPDGFDFDLRHAKAGGKHCGYPHAGFTRVLSDDYSARASGEMISQCATDIKHCLLVERVFPRDPTDSVSSEKFSHGYPAFANSGR
jgi:hypothetical protein